MQAREVDRFLLAATQAEHSDLILAQHAKFQSELNDTTALHQKSTGHLQQVVAEVALLRQALIEACHELEQLSEALVFAAADLERCRANASLALDANRRRRVFQAHITPS